MKQQLIEISKSSAKGLAGFVCSSLIFELPAADGLYRTIESKQGKLAYGIVNSILITATAVALYNLGR